ncbi:condensation domain-containing protein [Streptomyces sp. NPDC058646]|uniref:condensation domain-containing protein n=1 Tax=Streptomyces sp. NPDC058646 TaxID=3346574 RepID=UPI0036521CE0
MEPSALQGPAAVSVVIEPGPPPHASSWDVELRGPIDPAALEDVLGEFASGAPGRAGRRYRLLRHGPGRHTLRLTVPRGASAASVVGRFADLVTGRAGADRPLTPGQAAAVARAEGHRYEAVSVEPAAPLDADAVRGALRAVVAAHPQLGFRLDAARGLLTGDGAAGRRVDLVVEGEFTDEAGFAAAVDATGRTLDAYAGVQLRALLARDRRPAGPRADRLVLVVHALAVDAASWPVLLGDLAAALGTGPAGAPVRPQPGPDGLAGWIAELRELAGDPAEVRHWTAVADRRARAIGSPRSAQVAAPAPARSDGPGAAPAQAPGGGADGADGAGHAGFALDRGPTGRIVHDLAGRLALTTGQVLTGAFALALGRWQGVRAVGFDVRSDPRAGRQDLRRQVGRLADPYPVQFTRDPALGPLEQLAALAGPLAAGAGRAAGGAGFGACREWNPDPLLRGALRALEPALACLTLHGPAELLPDSARPAGVGVRVRPVHRVEARFRVVGGRLHAGLDWVSDPAAGVTAASVAALEELLREVLEELAEMSGAPIPSVFRATPQQAALYTGGGARPGSGRHVEQLVWAWQGPLDAERFTAAWQSVFDREAVLRTAFTGGADPQLMVHGRVAPEVTRQAFRADDWPRLLERDRLRGFDLRSPGALRLALLEPEEILPGGDTAPTRILLTYHRALLDSWSAHILLREFYRAYLAGGTLPGGERRPNLSDYAAWIAAQDLGPAREFWARAAPPDGAASSPGLPSGATGRSGVGRARLRLDPVETGRLARWAGTWGTAESSALQAVWAMLIHRASGATGPAPVRFSVTVSGRGIPLDGVSRMPGPLRNPLPMSVEVDPQGTVPALLVQLRDRVLDMAAYEWVPEAWIRAWSGRDQEPGAAGTVVVFEDPPHPVEGLADEIAALGIQAGRPGTIPARSMLPVGLFAQHDSAGGLVLTAVHDRALLGDEEAAELLVQAALLLRELPSRSAGSTTVAEVLTLLEGRAVPRMTEAAGAGRDDGPLVVLRAAGRERAGTICLIPPPGAPAACYDLLARTYPGPEELLVLTTGADGAQPALAALRAVPSLLLGGFSGAGTLACDIARRIAVDGGRPPRVVLAGGAADAQERARDLAQALQDALQGVAAPDA